jgi:hypothetical protein
MGRHVWFIPVLTSWSTVKIDDNLKLVLRCPTNGLMEVWLLPLNVRFTGGNIKGPIPDRDAHVIESKISKLHTLVYPNCAAHRNAPVQRTQRLRLMKSHSR